MVGVAWWFLGFLILLSVCGCLVSWYLGWFLCCWLIMFVAVACLGLYVLVAWVCGALRVF